MNDFFWGIVLLVSCAVLIIGYSLMVYAAYFVLPEVEERLSNCKLIRDTKSFVGNLGHFGRMYRYSMAGMVFTSTLLLSRKGMVDIDEVRGVSAWHRRWMCLPMRIAGVGFVTAMIATALRGEIW